MKKFLSKIKRFHEAEDGPTVVEYAVMLALIVAVCLTAINAVGTEASGMWSEIATDVDLMRTGQVN